MTWYKVLKEDALKDSDIFKVKAGSKELIVMKTGGKFYATSFLCTHEQYDLSEGFIDDGNLICPNHFAIFKPQDGTVVSNPEGSGEIGSLESYKVKVENGDVLVEVE